MSLKKELVYFLIIALMLGLFRFDWAVVRHAAGETDNLDAGDLYIVEAQELDDDADIDDDWDEDDFEYGEEYDEIDDEDGDEDNYDEDYDEEDYDEDEDWDEDEDYDDGDYDEDEDGDDEDYDDEEEYDDEDDIEDEEEYSEDSYDEMPSGDLYQESESGIRVRAIYGEDVFPAGTYMELTDVSKNEALKAASDVVYNAVDAAGVDISFFNAEGEEIEPLDGGEVRVALSLDTPLAGGEKTVVHVNDEGEATELADEDVTAASAKGAAFTATEFSLYLVVATEDTESVSISTVASETASPVKENTTLSVTPSTAVAWSSSNTKVATVDEKNGEVTAKSAGEATITAKGENGEIASRKITVVEVNITDDFTLDIGEEKTVEVTVTPSSIESVEWSIDTEGSGVAEISEGSGTTTAVTAKAAGKAKITAKITADGKTYTETCEVTVNPASSTTEVTDVSVTPSKIEIEKGNSYKLSATVEPEDAANKTLSWGSEDENVATVDENGLVTAVAKGETTITATSKDGTDISGLCKVTVTDSSEEPVPVTGVTLNKTSLTMAKGKERVLTATVSPDNATNKNVTWSSSDSSVASVDENGVVTANEAGAATITVTTADGPYTATCEVTVTDEPILATSIVLDKTTLTMAKDKIRTLTATVSPTNITEEVVWSSNDESIALVDENGVVTAKAVGTATIIATTEESNLKATCEVTVEAEYKTSVKTATTGSPGVALQSAGVVNGSDGLELQLSPVTAAGKEALQEEIDEDSLSYSTSHFFDLQLVDSNTGVSVSDSSFDSCVVTMTLPSDMPVSAGTVQVVSIDNNDLDMLLSRSGTINGTANSIQFSTTHFSPFAFLYTSTKSDPTVITKTETKTETKYVNTGGGTKVVYRDSDDDDDDDDDTSSSSSESSSYSPDIKQVRWWGTDKSTFYWSEKKSVTGYRLQYSTDSGFKKGKTTSVNSKKKNVTVTGMQKNQKYYVRVRAYQKSSDGKKTTWKPWSHRVIVKRKH
ncbi:MAG: Ig-like domain-containing protein [Lachnospiraceae bacterium]|nr:Ig-like domain-containing protein [Lachnospiraceae bacterium]